MIMKKISVSMIVCKYFLMGMVLNEITFNLMIL